MIVNTIKCPNCKDIIYSRCHHDFHYCSCGDTGIDGGFDYIKITAKEPSKINIIKMNIDTTRQELYNDWNNRTDKFGWIKGE